MRDTKKTKPIKRNGKNATAVTAVPVRYVGNPAVNKWKPF